MISPHQDSSPDPFWKAVTDAATPDAAEMAAEEAALCELERSTAIEPLSEEVIERLVARAMQPAPVPVMRPRFGAQRWLLAALLTVSVAAVALSGAKLVFWEEKFPRKSLDYATAVQLAVAPERLDSARRSAMCLIQDWCVYAAEVLDQLVKQQSEPKLGAKAKDVSIGLRQLLISGPVGRIPGPVDGDVGPVAGCALDERLSLPEREQALLHLEQLVRAGLTAMWAAPLVTTDAIEDRKVFFEVLLKRLGG